ncbi:MAG: hypothetical protein Q9167_005755, partial [Letrouitia subvulpina]
MCLNVAAVHRRKAFISSVLNRITPTLHIQAGIPSALEYTPIHQQGHLPPRPFHLPVLTKNVCYDPSIPRVPSPSCNLDTMATPTRHHTMPTHRARAMITVRSLAARSVVNLYPSVPEPTPHPVSISHSHSSPSQSSNTSTTIPAPAFWAVLAVLAFLILLIALISLAWCCCYTHRQQRRGTHPQQHHDLKAAESGPRSGSGYSGTTARSFFLPLPLPAPAYSAHHSQSVPDLRSPFATHTPAYQLSGGDGGALNPNHRDMRERIQELGNANPSLLGVIFEDPDPDPDPSTVDSQMNGNNVFEQQGQQQQRKWGAQRMLGLGGI